MGRSMPAFCIAVSTSNTPFVRFSINRTVTRDRRWDYGEDRYRLLGRIEGRVFVLIYTTRGSVIRLISARKANRKEVHEYEQNASQN